jgi:hypothetical protein
MGTSDGYVVQQDIDLWISFSFYAIAAHSALVANAHDTTWTCVGSLDLNCWGRVRAVLSDDAYLSLDVLLS